MVWELVKLLDHNLFENIQVSYHNVRLLSNVDPACRDEITIMIVTTIAVAAPLCMLASSPGSLMSPMLHIENMRGSEDKAIACTYAALSTQEFTM